MNEVDARIQSVRPLTTSAIAVTWAGMSAAVTIDLAGWIATGGVVLAPLRRPDIFETARIGDHGAAVVWGHDGDLAIDAFHLKLIEETQIGHAVRRTGT